MSAAKNIDIKIAATGGDQAAAEINKVKAAAEGITGFGGMLEQGDKVRQAQEKANSTESKL